jgi:hypothetical protein
MLLGTGTPVPDKTLNKMLTYPAKNSKSGNKTTNHFKKMLTLSKQTLFLRFSQNVEALSCDYSRKVEGEDYR